MTGKTISQSLWSDLKKGQFACCPGYAKDCKWLLEISSISHQLYETQTHYNYAMQSFISLNLFLPKLIRKMVMLTIWMPYPPTPLTGLQLPGRDPVAVYLILLEVLIFNSSPLDKMAAILQMTCSNAFSWMKMLKFRLIFHWSLFPAVQLTIQQHWFG